MSDWIDREAEKFRKNVEDREYRESVINLSNYWLALRQQIGADVERINSQNSWRHLLQTPVKIEDLAGAFYIRIAAATASAKVSVVNNADTITLLIETYRQSTGDKTAMETLKVIQSGRHVILKRMNEEFIVPEQASAHILSHVVWVLHDSV